MLGNLYVAAKYWAWGYSDGMANAGGSKGKQRKKYVIGERVYWADESELPGLILAAAMKPEAPDQTPAKPVKRAQKRVAAPVVVQVAKQQPSSPQDRLEAFRQQFQMADSEVLLRSLEIAAQRLADMEEEDEMVLLLA